MDIANIASGDRTFEIVNPGNGENLGVRITVCSVDDSRMVKIKRKISDDRLVLERRNKSFTASDIDENNIKMLLVAVLGWEWYSPTGNEADQAKYNGEVPDFTPANLRAILSDKRIPWFRAQINEEISDTESFFSV